ncbi:hypothetical protein RJT34_14097 [Clitoria ternatea]|uniref:Peptidase A1 domain-containing protein n=1 Tax=Clitoria ternatea TaxID=43366 RepID=A0AAN9JPR7_CLITE
MFDFLALLLILLKSSAFLSERPKESNHFHIVKLNSLLTASTCSPSNKGLGTPIKEVTLVIDTGSTLIWTQCQPCKLGTLHGCAKQRHPIFDPSKSSTYSNVTCPSHTCTLANTTLELSNYASSTCEYAYSYLDGMGVAGFLAKERLSVGPDTFIDIIFGCSEVNVNLTLVDTDGILGLDQGFLSFVEQTSKTYQKVFLYCLPSKASEIGFLKFGKAKHVSKSLKFTELGAGYVIPLVEIKLGNTKLPITFKKGAASIDSGSSISTLPSKDYITLRDAYRKAMSHYELVFDILDTCYHVGIVFPVNSSVVCLPFAEIPGGGDYVLFGNAQQKTLEIVYDVAGGKIGFGYEGCR